MVSFKIRLIPKNFDFESELIDHGLEVQDVVTLGLALDTVFGQGRYKASLNPFDFTPLDNDCPLQFLGITMNTDLYVVKIQALCKIYRDGKYMKQLLSKDGETISQIVTQTLNPGENLNDFIVDVLDENNKLFTRDLDIQLNKLGKEILLFTIVISQKIWTTPQFLLENNKTLKNGFFIQLVNRTSAIYYHKDKNIKGFVQSTSQGQQNLKIEELAEPEFGFTIEWQNGTISKITI